MPTFPPTHARSLLSPNSSLLISKPSAPFLTALPAHQDTVDRLTPASGYPPSCRPLFTPALLQVPLSPARWSLPPQRLSPGFRTSAASPLSPLFPGGPSPFARSVNNHTLLHTFCGLAASHLRLGSVSLPGYPSAHPPSGSPRGAPTSGSGTFFMMPVFLLLKVV